MVIFMVLNLGERLKELRLSHDLKQSDMANVLEISTRGYRHYELAEREPNLTTLIFLADYFNVSLDYLVGRTDDPTFEKK